MEARVLTLFDDEDFLPKPEPPKKPIKKAATAAAEAPEVPLPETAVTPDATAAEAETTPEVPVDAAEQPATAMPSFVEQSSPAAPLAPPVEIAASLISIELPGPAAVSPPPQTAEETNEDNAPEPEKTPEVPAAPSDEDRAADEELNRQLLSELIQTDYTALIHRDYPFDLQQASVVKKERSVMPPPQPEPAVEPVEAPDAEEEVFEEVVPLPEWNLDKKYYAIGEVAQLFAVNTSLIRFWSNEFKLKPRTTRKGDRLYSPGDIAELRLIHHLVKEKKHTIKGAREKLRAGKTGVHQKLDLKESLTSLRDMLVRIHEQL
ncbi:MerR family transcriptional regulator [Taibaiella koreensis]|uniref:MerR family transcriptional regulator n=1 Tax=Taibaiella koreensis TaxID=1268548 RepID=UPI001968D4BA|nr:MerR family transcriptional regulator [Taibaiella koreensis]